MISNSSTHYRSGLASSAVGGAVVSFVAQSIRFVIQIFGVVILSRLLSPFDHGLIAMVMTIVIVAEIIRDFGLSSSAIQAKEITDKQRSNLFWCNSFIGASIFFLLFICSSVLAKLYTTYEVATVTKFLSLVFIFNGMATQFRAHLIRQMQFLKITISDVGAQILGLLVGIIVALKGGGYWSLVCQQVVQSITNLFLVVCYGHWLPGPYYKNVSFFPFFKYGLRFMGSEILTYLARNLGQFIVGFEYGPIHLGFYNRAFQLLMVPINQLSAPALTVALPILSRLQHDDTEFNRYLFRGQSLLVHVIIAIFSFASTQADSLILCVLGEQWSPSIPLFRILAVAGIFQVLTYASYWTFLAKGFMSHQLRYALVSRLLITLLVGIGSFFGVEGIALAYLVGQAILWPFSLIWTASVTVFPSYFIFFQNLRLLLIYSLSSLLSYGISHAYPLTPFFMLFLGAVTMFLSLVFFYVSNRSFRNEITDIILLKKYLFKKFL